REELRLVGARLRELVGLLCERRGRRLELARLVLGAIEQRLRRGAAMRDLECDRDRRAGKLEQLGVLRPPLANDTELEHAGDDAIADERQEHERARLDRDQAGA